MQMQQLDQQRQQMQHLQVQRDQVIGQFEQLGQQLQLLQQNQPPAPSDWDPAVLQQAQQLVQQRQQLFQLRVLLHQQAAQLHQQAAQLLQQVMQVAPSATVHTAGAALVPALQRLPKLRACAILGLPVAESLLQLLPPSLLSLQVSQRAFRGPVSLAAASRLVALEVPDLLPGDTLPPLLHKLVILGRQRAVLFSAHIPLLPLTQLQSLEVLGCVLEPQALVWARSHTAAFSYDRASSSEILPSVVWQPNLVVSQRAKDRCSGRVLCGKCVGCSRNMQVAWDQANGWRLLQSTKRLIPVLVRRSFLPVMFS